MKKEIIVRSVSKRSRLVAWWYGYIICIRALLARCEVFFEIIGKRIATNPKKTVLIALIGVALSTTGLLRMRHEKRSAILFVPENSEAEQALRIGSSFFSNTFNTRTEELLIIPRNGSNVLDMASVQEALEVLKIAENISGYEDICRLSPGYLKKAPRLYKRGKICTQMNPLEIVTGREKDIQVLYRKFKRALQSTSVLMSNGRAAIFNLKDGFVDFKLDDKKQIPLAKALKIQIFLKQAVNSTEFRKIMNWESEFVVRMKSAKENLQHIKIFFSAEKSLDDAISESSNRDISLVSITFTVMITFSCLMLTKFINPVRGHTWLSIAGVLSTGLGILAGISITTGLGIPFINLVGVVPFLVVSIGIDDMFIIVDEFDRQAKSHIPENRIAFALSKVGATVTMTTVTDVVAFFISATSSFPAIRYFCIYTAITINVEFLLQITLFVAFLTFDAKRIFANRNDCCPSVHVQDRTCCRLPNDFSFAHKFMKTYGKYLLSTCGKTFVIISTVGLLAFGIYGCLNVDNEFNRKSLAVKGTYYSEYITTFESKFPQTVPVSIQLNRKVNYSDIVVRKQVSDLANIAYNTGYYLKQNFTWIHYFDDFVSRFGINVNNKNFYQYLKLFLSLPVYSQHNLDVILDSSNEIIASRVIVFLKDNSKSTFQKDAMLTLRQDLKKYSQLECTVASDPFLYFEQYAAVIKEVASNLVAVSTVITIMLIPFCTHPVIIILVNLGFTALIVEIFGLMYFWDIQLNAISMINIVMSVGFAVDYSAHIAHAFATSTRKSVNERIIDALSTVGGSVLLGGVSTFLGMSLTGLATSTIFQIFFKMFLGIILFGLFNGIAVLPVMLSICAPFLDREDKLSPGDVENVLPFKKSSKQRNSALKLNKKINKRQFSISVTGMSTRFPTARCNTEFQRMLQDGTSTLGKYPTDRHARDKYFESVFNPTRPVAGRAYVSEGSYVENIQRFDHQFFGISATEARSMDPQQRMLLQGVYEAIEDAGLTLEELQQCKTGVYVGIMNLDYSSVVLKDDTILSLDQFASTGTAFSIAANRISFSLNLTGPSIAIDTACSSSLTALSVACDHLERRCVDVAIVAAANLVLCPRKQITICRTNMLAPDGKCKVFDERANGYGRGEGVVAFVLKASDLVSYKDQPYCDILAWGVNNDGQTAAPITAPSVETQRGLMKEVLQQSLVDPRDVQYVEMHGTGTIIGDMVETKSVGDVYGKTRKPNNPVKIGSVKSNINHTESAAGLAGLAKVCIMMKTEKILPTVGIENQAVRLDIEEKNLVVTTKTCDWPDSSSKPKVAAINSFGYGGSNAHLIVREASTKYEHSVNVKKISHRSKGSMKVFVISARSQAALIDSAVSFSDWLLTLEDNDENISNVCYTLCERRSNHNARLAIAAVNLKEARELLTRFSDNPKDKVTGITAGKTSKHCTSVAFVFGGQGSQWLGMAGDILSNPTMFKEIKRIDKRSRKKGHKGSLLAYLKGEDDKCEEDCLVTVQLSIFALQYAVAKFLKTSASIIPTAVGGHSLGDITAACVAGIIKVKKAVDVIMARASLQDECKSLGAMAAIGLTAKEVEAILEKLSLKQQICIAAVNDKASVTISGDKEAIEKVEEYINSENKSIFWRKLATHKAFHSHHMDSIEEKFKERIKKANIKPKRSQTVFVSTTEGRRVEANEIDNDYWWNNLRNPVLFHQCVKKMLENGISVFIEISPRPVLSHYIKAIANQMESDNISVIQALPKKGEEKRLQHLYAQTIGQMYTLGYDVSFNLLQDQRQGKFIRFPNYPWQEVDLWVKDEFLIPKLSMNMLGVSEIVTSEKCTWENEIDLFNYKYLNDHKMKSAGIIMPGACYIEMALEASTISNKTGPVVLKDVVFQNILPLNEHIVRKVKCVKSKLACDDLHDFSVFHFTEQGDVPLARATLVSIYQKADENAISIAEAMGESKTSIETISETDSGVSILMQSQTEIQDSGLETSTDDHSEPSVPEIVEIPEDRVIMSKLNFGPDYEVLSSEQFKDLALQTGFDFGESFSLIEKAWSADSKALVRLKLPPALMTELDKFVVCPCIIDACLQACIAIGSKDQTRQVIPVGVKTVRLNSVSRKFRDLYGFAEIDDTTPDSCNVKLLNSYGQEILMLNGFQVKELSRPQRRPVMESSLYEMNWIPAGDTQKTDNLGEYDEFLILGFKDCCLTKKTIECLTDSGVKSEHILFNEIKGGDMVLNFATEFQERLEKGNDVKKSVIVINLLPSFAHSLSLGEDLALTAQWLCFESTLMILKILHESHLCNSKILVFCCQSFGSDMTDEKEYSLPWGSTSLGLARVTNIETDIPVIPIDLKKNPSKEDIKAALSSIQLRSVEEGLVVSPSTMYQPILQRVDPAKASVDGQLKEVSGISNFYVSWSAKEETFCIKNDLSRLNISIDDTVLIDIHYISSPTGTSKHLLRNVRMTESKHLLQCAFGIVIDVAENYVGLQPGDEVIAVYNSKWLKDRVRLPTEQVFKKPRSLSHEEASILPGLFALADNIMSKVLKTGEGITNIFIADNDSVRGLTWALASVASSKDLEVTWEGNSNGNSKHQLLKDISNEYLEANRIHSKLFDCIICPCDLHPVDREALISATRKDGVFVFLDNEFTPSTNQYGVGRSITVLNIKLLDVSLSHALLATSIAKLAEKHSQSILNSMPDSESYSLAEICSSKSFVEESAVLDCIKINLNAKETVPLHKPSMDIQGLKKDRSYMVIGGTKGLGLSTVSWLATRGAGTIIVVGRSEPSKSTVANFETLEERHGTEIKFVKADISMKKGVDILTRELEFHTRLAGVVNSAAVIDDKLFQDVDRESYQRVMQPKITGTLNLHNILESRQEHLDFFVLYSSITAVLGNSGQSSYSAANAFMNSFADYHAKILGKPCLAVCWGAMGGGGILERNVKVAMLLEKSGLHLLDIPTGLTWMDKVLSQMPQKSNMCICDIDWNTFLRSLPSKKANSIIYDEIRKELPEQTENSGNILEMILAAKSKEKQLAILLGYIKGWVAAWVSGSPEEIDCNVPMFTYGIDSVGATAIKGQIEKDLKIDFQVFYFMQAETTINKLAEDLLNAIYEKFIKCSSSSNDDEEEVEDEMNGEMDHLHKKADEDEDRLILPKDYLSVIYKSENSPANMFIVHPSHRYSGVFQVLGMGMRYQKIFSLYAFGWTEPSIIGEDIGSVKRLAKACIKLMLEVQPYGPYFLGGYSFGGLVSLEMASILKGLGKDVALVIMIDTVRWLPSGRNNSQLLVDMIDTEYVTEKHIQEQMKNFFCKIATRKLKMTLEEYESFRVDKSFSEIKDFFNTRAKELEIDIPDVDKILESTKFDQQMSSRCHKEWVPGDLYDGDILYLEAEDDTYCKSIVGVGKSLDCWASVLHKMPVCITCPGDHYSMMDASRGPEIGKLFSVAAMLKFRRLFPSSGRILLNSCQKTSLEDFKKYGMETILIKKKFGRETAVPGKLKLSKSSRKLKFISSGKMLQEKLKMNDVVNITKLETHSLLAKEKRVSKIDQYDMFAGITFIKKDRCKLKLMCLNPQHYRRLICLMEAVFGLKLPF